MADFWQDIRYAFRVMLQFSRHHSSRCVHARARHRRKFGNFFRSEQRAAAAAAVSRFGLAGVAYRSIAEAKSNHSNRR